MPVVIDLGDDAIRHWRRWIDSARSRLDGTAAGRPIHSTDGIPPHWRNGSDDTWNSFTHVGFVVGEKFPDQWDFPATRLRTCRGGRFPSAIEGRVDPGS